MPHPDPLDWLVERYAYRPDAIIKLMELAANQPTPWDAEQEPLYRGRILNLLESMLEIADATIADKGEAFRQRFTVAQAMEVQRCVAYLIFLVLSDQEWPEPVTWDHVGGVPRIYHLESMLTHAETTVLDLLARRLREIRGDD